MKTLVEYDALLGDRSIDHDDADTDDELIGEPFFVIGNYATLDFGVR